MRKVLLSSFCIFAVFNTLISQTTEVVVPRGYLNKRGNTSSYLPFAYEIARTQIIYRSTAVAKTVGVIFSVDFRRDSIIKTTYSSISRNLELDIYLTKISPRTMTTSFAANRGNSQKTIIFNNNINLPPLYYPSIPPAPWKLSFKFPKPFPFIPTKGNLLFEFICKGANRKFDRYYLDADYTPKTPSGKTSLIGMYCVGKNNEVFKIYPVEKTWILGGSGEIQWAPGGSAPNTIISYIGYRTDFWGPIKLPFDLRAIGGISYSKDPCMVRTNWIIGQVAGLNQKIIYGPIPKLPVLEGVTIYTDSLGIAPNANPLGLVSGPAFSITIGSDKAPLGDVNVIYSPYSISTNTGRFYSTTYFRGPIIRFKGSFN